MSEVEKFWNATDPKFGDNRTWGQLNAMEQQMVIQGVNLILGVIR